MAYKIGDKVRNIGDSGPGLTVGKVYTVKLVDNVDFVFIDDDNDNRWRDHNDSDYELVGDDAELTALRAWKASALARFPALEEPETDEEAADRFARDLEDEGPGEGVNDILLTAFAWARANPR